MNDRSHPVSPQRLAELGYPVLEVYEANGAGGIGAAGWHAPVAIALRDEAAGHELLRMLSLVLQRGGYARARLHVAPGRASDWIVTDEQVAPR